MGISHPQIVLNVVLCLISLKSLCNRRDVELNNQVPKDEIPSMNFADDYRRELTHLKSAPNRLWF